MNPPRREVSSFLDLDFVETPCVPFRFAESASFKPAKRNLWNDRHCLCSWRVSCIVIPDYAALRYLGGREYRALVIAPDLHEVPTRPAVT